MSSADREVRIDLQGNPTPFLLVVAAVLLGYVFWLWQFQPSLAPVLATLPLLVLLRFLRGPLTLQRAVLVRPERLVIASRLLLRNTKKLALGQLTDLREQQVGSKARPVWELELVLATGTIKRLGSLAPGFRPHLRSAVPWLSARTVELDLWA